MLGPKQGPRGWFWAVNVEATLSKGDDPRNYKAYIWINLGGNQVSKVGQVPGGWNSDIPGGEYVTRLPDGLVFSDNPGLQVPTGVVPGSVGQSPGPPAVFSALFAAAAVPDNISVARTAPWDLPPDTPIVLYRIRIEVVNGKMDPSTSQVVVVENTTAGELKKRREAAKKQQQLLKQQKKQQKPQQQPKPPGH